MLFILKYERKKTVKTSLKHFMSQTLKKHLKHCADNSMEHVFYKPTLSMFPV